MATLKNTIINTNTSMSLPTNATSSTGANGKIRYNTANSQNTLEFFDGTAWRPVTGFSAGLVGTGGDTISYVPGGGIVHMFTTVGAATFTPTFTGTVEVLVVAGGGGGGSSWGGGGGGGGVISARAQPVTATVGVPITVGGCASSTSNGGNSVFGALTATGGGQGGTWTHTQPGQLGSPTAGRPGGSGGGGSNTGDGIDSRTRSYGGLSVSGQGYPGGSGVRFNVDTENTHGGGSGGGAGGGGASVPDGRQAYRGSFRNDMVVGGAGRYSDILGTGLYYAGGGGGGGHLGWGDHSGGVGGGGGGGYHHGGPYGPTSRQSIGGGQALNDGATCAVTVGGGNGGANTGSGGGAHNGVGGSGIVIVRY